MKSSYPRIFKNKLLTTSEVFLYKNHSLPCPAFLYIKRNWGYSRNANSHYFSTNSILLLIKVDEQLRKLSGKHSQEETEMSAKFGLSAAEPLWAIGGGMLGQF